jgi:hypothetical protein
VTRTGSTSRAHAERLTCDIAAELRGRYNPLLDEAAAKLDSLLACLVDAENARDEAKADAAVLRSRMGQAQRAIHHRMVHRGQADACEQDLCLMLHAEPPQDTLPEGFDMHLADKARQAVALARIGYPKGRTPFLRALKIMRDKVLAEGGDGSLPLLKPYVEWALRGDHA